MLPTTRRTAIGAASSALTAALLGINPFQAAAAAPGSGRLRVVREDAVGRTAAAVVVGDVPLVHTAQLYPAGFEADLSKSSPAEQARELIGRLESVLLSSGSDLAGLVKLNVFAADAEAVAAFRKALGNQLPETARPAVTVAIGRFPPQPKGARLSLDAVAIEGWGIRAKPDPSQLVRPGFAMATVLPAGGVVYISGQAESGTDLADATKKTLAGLKRTIEWLGLTLADVVEIRSFLTPVDSDPAPVLTAFRELFGDRDVPAATFVEWTLGMNSIEIEMVVRSPQVPPDGETVEYLTPPWMTASPVFCRVTRCRRPALAYIGGVVGNPLDMRGELMTLFESLRTVTTEAGSDFLHLAKATYFVEKQELIGPFGKIRPAYYDPKRPPAASLAPVREIARDVAGRAGTIFPGMTIDMIAVAKP